MGILINIFVFAFGFLFGCWFYRQMLKREPEKLEKLVEEVNLTDDRAEALFARLKKAWEEKYAGKK